MRATSFVQPRIVRCLRLPVEPTQKCNVLVGNGQNMKAEGFVKHLTLKIQGNDIIVPAYLLSVSGADVILGAPWLASLGPHVADYAASRVKFYSGGHFITLQGETDCKPDLTYLHHFKRLHHIYSISEMFTVHKVDPVENNDEWVGMPENVDPEMDTLYHTYRVIFQIPKGLPPNRELDNEIVLKADSQPVKVKPYRYPHSEKEKMVLNQLLSQKLKL